MAILNKDDQTPKAQAGRLINAVVLAAQKGLAGINRDNASYIVRNNVSMDTSQEGYLMAISTDDSAMGIESDEDDNLDAVEYLAPARLEKTPLFKMFEAMHEAPDHANYNSRRFLDGLLWLSNEVDVSHPVEQLHAKASIVEINRATLKAARKGFSSITRIRNKAVNEAQKILGIEKGKRKYGQQDKSVDPHGEIALNKKKEAQAVLARADRTIFFLNDLHEILQSRFVGLSDDGIKWMPYQPGREVVAKETNTAGNCGGGAGRALFEDLLGELNTDIEQSADSENVTEYGDGGEWENLNEDGRLPDGFSEDNSGKYLPPEKFDIFTDVAVLDALLNLPPELLVKVIEQAIRSYNPSYALGRATEFKDYIGAFPTEDANGMFVAPGYGVRMQLYIAGKMNDPVALMEANELLEVFTEIGRSFTQKAAACAPVFKASIGVWEDVKGTRFEMGTDALEAHKRGKRATQTAGALEAVEFESELAEISDSLKRKR